MKKYGWNALALFLLAVSSAAQPGEPALALLEVSAKRAGWDGVELDMSMVQAERRLGLPLAPEAKARAGCGPHAVDVDRNTLRLTLGFSGLKPGAKIETLYVHFEGYQVLTPKAALVAELLRLAPGASLMPDAAQPAAGVEETERPSYALPGTGGFAIRLDPGAGLLLTYRRCLT